MKHDPLGVIEAAYRLDLDTTAWLGAVGEAVYEQMGVGLGILAFDYHVTADDRLQVGSGSWQRDMPPGVGDQMRRNLEHLPEWFVRATYARCDADTASQGGGNERVRQQALSGLEVLKKMFGWHDIFVVSGIDPTRHGVYFGAWLDKETQLAPAEREMWTRISVHLASAHRLRRRLAEAERGPDTADAVITPGGRIDHARDDARDDEARRELREAVIGVEHARGDLRRIDIDQAVDSWRGLVSSRWTLVDYFESHGERYVLARRNDLPAERLDVLTTREHQALSYAALGHNNKLIGYEMGISPSTVGVLLHRASQKLGTHTRDDLVARFTALSRSE